MGHLVWPITMAPRHPDFPGSESVRLRQPVDTAQPSTQDLLHQFRVQTRFGRQGKETTRERLKMPTLDDSK